MNSQEEIEIIRTVLSYCETGATHMEPTVIQNPVSHYTASERLQQEIDVLFRQFPIIAGHSSQLSEAGDFLTHDDTGVPLLLTRNRENQVRAFINVCRHRGARVASEPFGQANTFACPYHGWTYDLNGQLRGMRQPEGFGDLIKTDYGLVEVPAFERFGLVWVRPSPAPQPVDIDAWLAPMAEQLGSINLADHSLYKEWTLERNMHWRIALEGFQESYHFCTAHKDTACSTYLDNQSVFIDQYPHVRHAVPLARIKELQGQSETAWYYRANFMTQNYLFPCNFVQVMTDHVYIHSILPTGIDSCVFKCQMLIPEPARTEKAKKYWDANYNVVRTVFEEDFIIGEGIQRGFAAHANTDFLIGRYETGLQLGRRALEDALQGRLSA